MDEATKRCRTCGQLKSVSSFYKRAHSKDGRQSRCKGCTREYDRSLVKPPCSIKDCPNPHQGNGYCHIHNWRFKRYGDPLADKPIRGWHPLSAECAVPDCSEPPKSRDLCPMHWSRWHRRGDPLDAGPTPRERCEAPDCDDPQASDDPQACAGLCKIHLGRVNKHGDLNHRLNWTGDAVGYHGVHHRLREMRGLATDHACQHCGEPAKQWAYDHADPNEGYEPNRGPYSTDPAHYLPLCHRCHYKLDHGPERDKL